RRAAERLLPEAVRQNQGAPARQVVLRECSTPSGGNGQKREEIQRGRNREDRAGDAVPAQDSITGRPCHGGELVESVALFLPSLEIPILHEQLGRALLADDAIP